MINVIDRKEVEASLGLDYFCVPGEGIGGILKTRVDDFRVKEQARTPSLDPKGRFTVIRATLRGLGDESIHWKARICMQDF